MRRALGVAAIAALLIVVACNSNDELTDTPQTPAPTSDPTQVRVVETPSASASCSASQRHAAGEFDETVESGGITRDYVLHVPTGYDSSGPVPLVLLFHGFALDGRIMLDYTGLGAIADREDFAVVSPTGTGDPHRWNTADGLEPNDLLFVNDLLDKLEEQVCIDTTKVFATGYSNGGGMSMYLACNASDRVAAVGLVAAVYLPCTPKTPLIAFHGTEDTLVAFEGRGEGEGSFSFPAISDAVASWAGALGCAATPEVGDATEHVEQTVYADCSAGGSGAVQFYVVDGGGHSWPGATLFNNAVATTQEITASELIWEFFKSHSQ
jgi:polyhydroxybutyrate depolymerase